MKDTIAIAASSLASLPHDALIALYNAESRRLSHGAEPHLVDNSCKPDYIIGLFGTLAIRARQAAEQRSNELAAMSPVSNEPTRQSKEDSLMSVPLNVAQEFRLMR